VSLATDTWCCTWPRSEEEWVEYCNRASGGVGINDGPSECWTEFGSSAEREAHQREAHPTYWRQIHEALVSRTGEHVAAIDVIPEYDSSPAPTTGPKDDAPSEKQLAFIAALAERKGVEARKVETKAEASDEIERLSGLDDAEPFRRNKFDSPCSECGGVVPAGEGVLRKDDDTGRWIVGHVSCPDESDLPPEIPSGHYAVTAEEGHTSFYKVTAGRKPGVLFVDLLIGGGANGAFVRTPVPMVTRPSVLAKIAGAGIEDAALRFRQEAGRCVRCGRGLSNKVSRDEMMGPECRRKV